MTEDIDDLRMRFLDQMASLGLDASQVLMDNQPATNVDEKKVWVRFQIRPGFNKEEQIGGTHILITQLGVVILQVFAPPGSGSKSAYTICDKFNAIYRKWRSISTTGHLRTMPWKVEAIPSDKNLQINVTVEYESLRRYPR